MKILITGSNGLLGQKILYKLRLDKDVRCIATSKGINRVSEKKGYTYLSLDITNENSVSRVIAEQEPDVVINTAAMTNVDLCEDERKACDNLNENAVQFLADACLKIGAHLIHISSDFIFDGKDGPYSEEDKPNPISYYGASKYKSEQLLYKHNVKWTILRTIIVFGVGEKLRKGNLILWAKEALEKGDKINVVDDQFRAPTLAEDLADICILAAKKKRFGIFNASGKEIMSICEIVERIAKYYGKSTENLNIISTHTLNQKAVRPSKTGFILDKSIKELGYSPHSFEECLSIIDQQLKQLK